MKTTFLGLNIPYLEGIRAMREATNQIESEGNQLLFLEHADTITYTRQYGFRSFKLSLQEIQRKNIEVLETNRGGDVTFHGQGQLVGYPILKLPPSTGAVDYVRKLESALLAACQDFGILNARLKCGKTGIWVGDNKLIAIGVGLSRQITRHGFALNISTNLERFTECITPCGLKDLGVTSLERLIKTVPTYTEAIQVLSWHLSQIC